METIYFFLESIERVAPIIPGLLILGIILIVLHPEATAKTKAKRVGMMFLVLFLLAFAETAVKIALSAQVAAQRSHDLQLKKAAQEARHERDLERNGRREPPPKTNPLKDTTR